MKRYVILLSTMFLFNLLFSQITLDKVVNKATKKTEQRANRKIDKTIDKGLDNVEDAIDGSTKKEKSKKDKTDEQKPTKDKVSTEKEVTPSQTKTTDSGKSSDAAPKGNEVVWNKFDFIPGDKVVFEDAPSASERNGEFPSRWDLKSGVAEIVNVNGENVICFMSPNTEIVPYLKNAKKPYLPDIFTVEMDLYFPKEYSHHRYYIYLYDRKNHQNAPGHIIVYVNGISIGSYSGTLPGSTTKQKEDGGWKRVSIAYTNGQLKVYLDDTRLINIPRYEEKPTGITVEAEMSSDTKKTKYLKNFRIAEGGVPYYDRAMQDGKIIVTGIRFDVGKATLRPESMGPINEILYVLKKNPDLKFSVEGHTDTDGNETSNQKLSEDRAKTVMDKLIELGIDKSRLAYKGFGQSKPMSENNTPEGKAQNRRVEFVKM